MNRRLCIRILPLFRRPAWAGLLLLLVLVPFLPARADSWEDIRAAAERITSIEARFVQKKTLPILAKPFVSGGRFFFQAPGSLRWEYDRPIRSVLLMHAGSVKRFIRERDAWRDDAGAALPAMQVVLSEIANWQRGRFDANPHFQASLGSGPEPRVLLVPRDAAWKKMIRQIELTLSAEQAGVMKSVRVIEDERNFTVLEFNEVKLNRPLPVSLFVNVE